MLNELFAGIAGLNRIFASVSALRLAQDWDDFNDHRIRQSKNPENEVLRGLIDDSRRGSLKSLFTGVIEIVNFTVLFIIAMWNLQLYQPDSMKPLVQCSAWVAGTIALSTIVQLVSTWQSRDNVKKVRVLSSVLSNGDSKKRNSTFCLQAMQKVGFLTGAQEGFLQLCPGYSPTIDPNRQIGLELKFIEDELSGISRASDKEILYRLDAAEEKYEAEVLMNLVTGAINLVIVICLGIPVIHFFNAVLTVEWFGTYVPKVVLMSSFLGETAFVVSNIFALFVAEPTIESTKISIREKVKLT